MIINEAVDVLTINRIVTAIVVAGINANASPAQGQKGLTNVLLIKREFYFALYI